MDIKQISPDATVYFQWGFVELNTTILSTWIVMVVMVGGAWLITRRLSSDTNISRWQHVLEVLVLGMRDQIREIMDEETDTYLSFIGTLFLFIAVSNVLGVIPWFTPPTASLSTTAGLALCVVFAVVLFGIASSGILGFLKKYVQPTPIMLPFNLVGELSRTLALAVRLFGNVMSGAKIVAILLAVAPLFFPVIMNVLGLLTGLLQAYIFAVLAAVYIASAARAQRGQQAAENEEQGDNNG